MGKPVSSNVKRVNTTALNTKVNAEMLRGLKDRCAYLGYPMNIVLETFMNQYANGKFDVTDEEILKWKKDDSELEILSTTFNKEIYADFKHTFKSNGFFVKHVLTMFMEKFSSGNLMLEYVDITKTKTVEMKEDF